MPTSWGRRVSTKSTASRSTTAPMTPAHSRGVPIESIGDVAAAAESTADPGTEAPQAVTAPEVSFTRQGRAPPEAPMAAPY